MLEDVAVYEKWLSELRPGDLVAYSGYANVPTVSKVKKRTPTGRITLENGSQWKSNGSSNLSGHYARLKPVTPQIMEAVHRRSLLRKIERAQWDSLTTEQLEAVVRLTTPTELKVP